MKAPKFVVIGLTLVFALSLFTVFAQATPQKPQEPKKPEAKPAQREIIPKEIRAIMQEGLATRQGRQDIPFTIFKSLVFPVQGGMHAVIFFRAKNSDLGYAVPAPAAPAPADKNKPAQPAAPAPAASMLEARLALALEFLQPDQTGALKVYKDASFGANLQTESAGYDPNKEEWYSLGLGLPCGKYTVAMLFAYVDPKKGVADIKKVGVSYYDLVLPGPETYQNALETTPLFFARNIEQMPSYEARPTVHKGLFTYSVLQIVPNIDSVVTAEDKSQIEALFFVLGAKAKEEPAGQAQPAVQTSQPKYEVEINFEVQKEDGSTAIKWETQDYVSPLIDQILPLKRTLKTGEKIERKDLEPGKYTLVIKIKDKVSGLTLDKKMPFEVK
ncbi:MAG: hypothetical protein ABSG19_04275 [Candidatus Aminicenantales bacterium]